MYGVFSYSENDLSRISGIFGGSREFLAAPSVIGCKYEACNRKQIELQLHGLTLTEYLHVQRIPRGLRVNLQPTLFARNDEFKMKFAGILNKCSRDIMALNIEFIERELKEIEVELSTMHNTMSTVMSSDDLQQFQQKLDDLMQQYRNDVITRKKQKFDRDTADYERGMVYNWSQMIRGRERSRSGSSYRYAPQQFVDRPAQKEGSPFLSTGGNEPDEVNENKRDTRRRRERKQQPRRDVRNK
ncbi:hypothetical protein XELAEV_18030048mg [Xenopus laevis]|uniref:Uncharacterized protein n=1 Tax=Xenopus laevis TaxID=8355 RepID=A0A974CT83_XENLA|nr:hypothetical protein XELAEV_18030048mg [Xenopus laevis]